MDVLKLCFILLAALLQCDSQEIIVKTIGKQPDMSQLCTNETQNIITLIICKISTERRKGEECRLVYKHETHGQDFEHGCDSRFTLITKNQTINLHLTNLTPSDSGNLTCECSQPDGTRIIHINITVEEIKDNILDSTEMTALSALAGILVFIIILIIIIILISVLLGIFHRILCHRKQPESPSCHPDMVSGDIEPYSTFIHTGSGLYSTVKIHTTEENVNISTREEAVV